MKKVSHFTSNPLTRAIALACLTGAAPAVAASACPATVSHAITGPCTLTNGADVTITNTGSIAGGFAGVAVLTGAVAGNIVNQGVVTGSSIGILINTSSVVTGSILNTGTISAADNGFAIAFQANAQLVGGVSNTGILDHNMTGIYVKSVEMLDGGIVNSGTIDSYARGIMLFNSALSGGITNSGNVSGEASSAIFIKSSEITGDLTNSGTLHNGYHGVEIYDTTIDGDVVNSGSIQGDSGVGIYIQKSSTVVGDIRNTGTIEGNQYGIAIKGTYSWDGTYGPARTFVMGDVINEGNIDARGSAGITLDHAGIYGDLVNEGVITSGWDVVGLGYGSFVEGSIINHGKLIGDGAGIVIGAGSSATSIINTGTISAGYVAIAVFNQSSLGSLINTGVIRSPVEGWGAGAVTVYSDDYFTLINRGVIDGGVSLSGSGVIELDGGSIVNGNVDAGGDFSVLVTGATQVSGYSNVIFNISGDFENTTAGSLLFQEGDVLIPGVPLMNNGLVSVASGATGTIQGDYVQGTSGVMNIGVNGIDSIGRLTVTGTADFSQGNNFFVDVLSVEGIGNGTNLDNVISAGNLVDNNGMTVTDNSYLLDFSASNDGNNHVDLIASMIAVSEINKDCLNKVCEGAGNAIGRALQEGDPDFVLYTTLPDATAFEKAATQASPALVNENTHVLADTVQTVLDVVKKRMHSPSNEGAASGDAVGVAEQGWISAYGANLDQDSRDGVDGYDSDARGVVVAVESLASAQVVVGAALAIGDNQLDGKGMISNQHIDSDVYQGMIYGRREFGDGCYFFGQGAVGVSKNDSDRHIVLFSDTAKADYNSWFANLFGELGQQYVLNDRLTFIPSFSTSYLYIDEESYTEHGSTMDLHVNARDQDALVLGVNLQSEYEISGLDSVQAVTLTPHIGAAYNVLAEDSSVKSNFVAGGAQFTTDGMNYDDVVLRAGLGLRVDRHGPWSGSINYDVQKGNDADTAVWWGSVKYQF